MKANNIFGFIAALITAFFVTVSCGGNIEPEGGNENGSGEIPQFPSLVENYQVSPGETLSLTIEPNMDWTISVPEENPQWFSILDGTLKVTKLSGKASTGKITVKIVVSEREEFDNNRSTEVSMTMGGKTQVIAKYMRPAKEKVLAVYAAERGEDGELKLAEDGTSYVYAEEPASSLELAWSSADADFRAPVKVESNCEWLLENTCDWLDVNVPETTTGMVELVFTGIATEDKTGSISFKSGEKVLTLNVSIPSCAGIDVYSAQSKDGDWEYVEGDYKWSSDPVDDITLVWMADCRMPLKIDSKCNWTLKTPEWLKVDLPENTSGEVHIVLLGDPMKYPLDDASGKIEFMLGEEKLHEVTVNIPGCRDIMSYTIGMNMTEYDFNYLGDIKTELGYVEGAATATVKGTSEVSVFAVECTGGVYDTENVNPEWLTISVSEYQKGEEVLQSRDVTISVTENTGDERRAMVFFLPSDMSGNASALFNDARTEVKEEYQANAVSLVQYSNDMEYLVVDATEEEMTEAGTTFTNVDDEKKETLTAQFGQTNYVYTLTYQHVYSRDAAFLQMARPFTSYRIFDEAYADKTSDSSFWLMFTDQLETRNYGVIDMYHNMTLPEEPSLGYVVFYDSQDNVLAIVECISPRIEAILELSENVFSLSAEESVVSVTLTTNVSWTSACDSDWCTVTPSSSEGSADLEITVAENTSDAERSAAIVITARELTKTIYIKQAGKADEGGSDEEDLNVYEETTSYFRSPSAAANAGAKMYKCLAGPMYDAFAEYNVPVLLLTYPSEDVEVDLRLPSKAQYFQIQPYAYSQYLTISGMSYSETSGIMDTATNYVSVKMHAVEEADAAVMDSGIKVLFHKDMNTDNPFIIIYCKIVGTESE